MNRKLNSSSTPPPISQKKRNIKTFKITVLITVIIKELNYKDSW